MAKAKSNVAKAKSKAAKAAPEPAPVPEAVKRYATMDPRWQAFYETIVTAYQAWSDPANRPG